MLVNFYLYSFVINSTRTQYLYKTYNVIEDIKILNDKDNVIGGFIPIDRCLDNSKTFLFNFSNSVNFNCASLKAKRRFKRKSYVSR
jgi:hypothetical protein